jgi:transposase-like protein
MKGIRKHEKPEGIIAFLEKYKTEDDCREALFHVRWPGGFVCPNCGGTHFGYLKSRKTYQCNRCKKQVSVTAGTPLHRSHLPLKKWFLAIYFIATDKRGISAMTLCKQISVTYKTAWYMLHRLRSAMQNADEKYILEGIVEFDDAYFGGTKSGGKRGRGTSKSKVLIGLSKTSDGKPRALKMQVVENLKAKTIAAFARKNIAEGARVETDSAPNYRPVFTEKWMHDYKIFDASAEMLVWLHTILSNVKSAILGTSHGLDKKHLQRYLDEACYRFNRRHAERTLPEHLMRAVIHAPVLGLDVLTG